MKILRSFWLQAVVLVLCRSYGYFRIPFANEDAYITFRYARNLALGLGPTYNLGERVMGFTSPLWTLWTALGFILHIDPVVFTRVTNLSIELLALWLILKLVPNSIAGWLFATWGFYCGLSASGIEMPLLLCLTCLSVVTGSWWALLLLCLTRPEGILMAAVVSLWVPWSTRLKTIAGLLLPAGLLAWYYGSAIPHSVSAKASTYGIHPFAHQWWNWCANYTPQPGDIAMLDALLPILLTGMVIARKYPRIFWPLASVWLAYLLSGTPYFWWYLACPLTAIVVLSAHGLKRYPAFELVAVVVSLILLPAHVRVFKGRMDAEQRMLQVSTAIQVAARPQDSVLAEPIGILGYQSGLHIIDPVGLVTPQPPRLPGWLGNIIRASHPDFIVLRGVQMTLQSFDGGVPELFPQDLNGYSKFYWLRQDPTRQVPADNELCVLRRIP